MTEIRSNLAFGAVVGDRAGREALPVASDAPEGDRVKARPRTGASLRAEDAFRARVAELGGTVLEPTWLGAYRRHGVRCRAGHDAAPRPSDVKRGGGICRTCSGTDPRAAEQAFRARVAELGGTVLESAWLGAMKPHRIRCAEGHEGAPRPHDVASKGSGICRACGGRDPEQAWSAFRARVKELGGTVLEPVWLGALTPHRALCAAGHPCTPRPASVQQGGGLCMACRNDRPGNTARIARVTAAAEQAFRARVQELGGTVVEPVWLGNNRPHRVVCRSGHACAPRPAAVQQGQGLCRVCAGNDPASCEQAFRARVAQFGGTVLEPVWLGRDTPHRILCPAGHRVTPQPGNVLQGAGMCRLCAGKTWDVFYVVADDNRGWIKFGVTSGDPAHRLNTHARTGFTRTIRRLTNLPDGTALELERSVLATLRRADEWPVFGREYYDNAVEALVLDLVDNYPLPTRDRKPRSAPGPSTPATH
ncbi:hypothetical protein F7Q99_36910 [Streptomyces kaniharaensis]|uniref:Uncharacterized protein n=1 Tax=Streptomyces kaniharaensis TaxID=212423 RepID=A0A6N7L6A1_9ACTN|nr:hypothetical protein [Streptomyces kaniharaensis]MQS17623.1 hypothetical protein [Streptomyces kaniharaensis]